MTPRVIKDDQGDIIELRCSYDTETLGKNPADGRKVKGVIHWVSAVKNVPAEIRLYDRLFTVANPGAADDINEILNPDSLVIKQGFAEWSLANAEPLKAYQFEREGYFCVDDVDTCEGKLVFNRTVTLRYTWGKTEED